jgi:hypothetical protein
VRSPFFTGPLRSPSRLQNTFAHESFMDEIAARVKADPVEYRLRHLRDPRLIDVVKAAAKGAGWDTRPSPRPGRAASGVASGRGFASVLYEGDNGYCALVALVDVDQTTGRVQVTRLVGSQDCGPISSPDGMRNQIGGGAPGEARARRAVVGRQQVVDRLAHVSQPHARRRAGGGSADQPARIWRWRRRDDHHADRGRHRNAIFDATTLRIREVPHAGRLPRAEFPQWGRVSQDFAIRLPHCHGLAFLGISRRLQRPRSRSTRLPPCPSNVELPGYP